MKKELKRVLSIAALVLMIVVCMTSCGVSPKDEKAVTDETKGSTATSVADNTKTETLKEPGNVDQSFIWPIEGFDKSFIENGFGNYKNPINGIEQFHTGVDIKANLGDKVLASADGKVVMAQWYGGYGQCVVIEHKDGIQTLYGHLDEILVKKDTEVKKGDTIGLAGSTGFSIKPHVQFEIRVMDKNEEYQPINPEEFIREQIER